MVMMPQGYTGSHFSSDVVQALLRTTAKLVTWATDTYLVSVLGQTTPGAFAPRHAAAAIRTVACFRQCFNPEIIEYALTSPAFETKNAKSTCSLLGSRSRRTLTTEIGLFRLETARPSGRI